MALRLQQVKEVEVDVEVEGGGSDSDHKGESEIAGEQKQLQNQDQVHESRTLWVFLPSFFFNEIVLLQMQPRLPKTSAWKRNLRSGNKITNFLGKCFSCGLELMHPV